MKSSATIRPVYVTDTHTLLWYLKQDPKLSSSAMEIFRAAEHGETRIVVSVIVIAELYYLNKRQKFFESFVKLYADLKTKPYFQLLALEPDDILNFDTDAAVPEMHDRIITGLARRLGAPLITIDPQITAAGLVEVIW